MSEVSFRVSNGDKIGLVGRNGAGKTTLTKTLAGDLQPAGGLIEVGGEIGYLPQDPRSGDPEELARTRILNARGLGSLVQGMAENSMLMGDADEKVAAEAMRKYGELADRFDALGGYAAEAEAASIASNLQLPDRILDQPLKTLSGGQRRRIELARILFSGAETMLLDEPTQGMGHEDVNLVTELIKQVAKGRTVLMVEHNMKVVANIAHTISVLQRGEVIAEGPYEQVSRNPQVMEAYMGTADTELQGH